MLLVIIVKDCLFCKISNGDIPSKNIYEDDKVFVIMDINPVKNGHLLVIPKSHYTDFTELDSDILLHINSVANDMTKLIYERLNANGVKLVVNYGVYQEVKHYHLHIIPSYEIKQDIVDIDEIYKKIK